MIEIVRDITARIRLEETLATTEVRLQQFMQLAPLATYAKNHSGQYIDANPAAYLPAYGGYCANGIAFGIPWGGNAEDFIVHDGKLYIFGGELSKQAVLLDLEKNLALADSYWEEEVKGNNSLWQRARRLIIRVPHYQTGAEQAAAVEAAQNTR